MKTKLILVCLWFGAMFLNTQAQNLGDYVGVKGELHKKSISNPCLSPKENFYIQGEDEDLDLDFSKYKTLMDLNAYYRQPVVIEGIIKEQNHPAIANMKCRWMEVKDIHFAMDIPEKKRPVQFVEAKGYRLIAADKNPHNDYLVLLSQTDFNRYFAKIQNGTATPLDFNQYFVVAVGKNDPAVGTYLNPKFRIREKDRTIKFSYQTAQSTPALPAGATSCAVFMVDKVDYQQIIFEENGKPVFYSTINWKEYTPPAADKKKLNYDILTGFRMKNQYRKDGAEYHLIQTQKEMEEMTEKSPSKEVPSKINFINELVVMISRGDKNAQTYVLEDVTIENRVVHVRYTIRTTPSTFPTWVNKGLILEKRSFDKVIFYENGIQSGELTRQFKELKVQPKPKSAIVLPQD